MTTIKKLRKTSKIEINTKFDKKLNLDLAVINNVDQAIRWDCNAVLTYLLFFTVAPVWAKQRVLASPVLKCSDFTSLSRIQKIAHK